MRKQVSFIEAYQWMTSIPRVNIAYRESSGCVCNTKGSLMIRINEKCFYDSTMTVNDAFTGDWFIDVEDQQEGDAS